MSQCQNIFRFSRIYKQIFEYIRLSKIYKWISEYICPGEIARIQIQIIFEGHFIPLFKYSNILAHHWTNLMTLLAFAAIGHVCWGLANAWDCFVKGFSCKNDWWLHTQALLLLVLPHKSAMSPDLSACVVDTIGSIITNGATLTSFTRSVKVYQIFSFSFSFRSPRMSLSV